MTKLEIIKKLENLKIPYSPDDTKDNLYKLYQDNKQSAPEPEVETLPSTTVPQSTGTTEQISDPPKVDSDEVKDLLKSMAAEIQSLKSKDEENQRTLKMLYEVADKGRVFNYENNQPKKQSIKVKLSVFSGQIVIGWRNLKDEKIFHPQTGKQIGENQEYELLLIDKEGNKTTTVLHGYEEFSNARYAERIDTEVISKKEDWQGNYTFDIKLPDGRVISLDSRFVN